MPLACLDSRKEHARAWFESLRNEICGAFEALEVSLPLGAPYAERPSGQFVLRPWSRRDHAGAHVSYQRSFLAPEKRYTARRVLRRESGECGRTQYGVVEKVPGQSPDFLKTEGSSAWQPPLALKERDHSR